MVTEWLISMRNMQKPSVGRHRPDIEIDLPRGPLAVRIAPKEGTDKPRMQRTRRSNQFVFGMRRFVSVPCSIDPT